MNILSEFTQRAADSTWTTDQQLIAANDGALYIATRLELLATSGNIDITGTSTIGSQSFDLISEFSTFLKLDRGNGVFFYDGVKYRPLKIVSESFMNENIPHWNDTTPEKPNVCWKKGKDLYIHPASSANYTNGIKVNYFAKPAAMAADGDDPFDSRTDLENLHEGVVLYMIWKAKQSIGEYTQANVAYSELMKFIRETEIWVNKDEEAFNEGFTPYRQTPTYRNSDPSFWGNY